MGPDAASRAMLLTGPGAGAIAVVRIRGPRVTPFLRRHFSHPAKPLRCVHGELLDEHDEVIDDPVIVLQDDQMGAEINLHGGPWIVASALDLLRRGGFEVLDHSDNPPLEFVDGQTTIEREVLAWIPMARTEATVRMLLAQPAAWETFLACSPEAGAIQRMLNDPCLERLLRPPRVAIIGVPNVGKSTLANQLFAQERSITADLPGTTRDWVGDLANIDGLAVMLIDTPGMRVSDDAIEQSAIEASQTVMRAADLVIAVIDASARPPVGDSMIEQYPDAIIVANKLDRASELSSLIPGAIRTIATTGQGIHALRDAIRHRLGCGDLSANKPRCWTARQREFLQQMLVKTER